MAARLVVIRPCRTAQKANLESQPMNAQANSPPNTSGPATAVAPGAAQAQRDYRRIEAAIAHIAAHHPDALSLDEIAAAANLSPFHFQRLFTRWAGVSPKQFARYLSLGQARAALRGGRASCLDAAFDAGLSGPGRLHDMFVTIEAMTPGEFRRGGAGLEIGYGFAPSLFGEILVAATSRGICHLGFVDDRMVALDRLRAAVPAARLSATGAGPQANALQAALNRDWTTLAKLRLHLHGTPFQMKVWEALLRIPAGRLASYGDVAAVVGAPDASRAVGTAVGANPVAWLIPCHRVIRQSGAFGGYRWGTPRKQAMIGWEAAQHDAGDASGG